MTCLFNKLTPAELERQAVLVEETGESVPCKICGDPTKMTGTQLCDRCWEIDHRIDASLPVPVLNFIAAKVKQLKEATRVEV